MSAQKSPHYLKVIEEIATSHRVTKERIETDLNKTEEEFSTIKIDLDRADEEWRPIWLVLNPLEKQREQLNSEIRERKIKIPKIEKELEKLKAELSQLESEIDPIRKEIVSINRRSKGIRDNYSRLWWKHDEIKKKIDELNQRRKETNKSYTESYKQYWLALQWEKRKPITIVFGLVFLLLIVLAGFVWAAKQLPTYGLVMVILVTFATFFTIVITLLRQDEKLKEKGFIQLARDLINLLGSILKK